MKADQLNRFMRCNGRKNLWLLRNTNQLYEHAVKTYYQRNSLQPYNPKSQEAKTRDENRGPVRTLTSQRDLNSLPDYPRNHQQMADQANNANSGNLLNTVMQATRRRSMSFTGNLPSYIYNNSEVVSESVSGSGHQRPSRERRRDRRSSSGAEDSVEELKLGILNGRSMSLPPRTTLELGIDKSSPCHKHHINAIERSTSAAIAALARHKNDDDADKLMLVDQALKDRLAVRFDHQTDDEPMQIPARFGLGYSSAGILDGRPLTNIPRSYTMPSQRAPTKTITENTISKEQTRFQTLGERIRHFRVIQFADGPVTYQAFNRRHGHGHGYGKGRAPTLASSNNHIPKQEPCLSFRNVLHTNHRQRSLNSQSGQSQSLIAMSESQPQQLQVPKLQLQEVRAPQAMQLTTAPPLGPLEPLAPIWRPQQQQQQQQQPKSNTEPSLKLSNSKLSQSKIKRTKLKQSNIISNSSSNKGKLKVKARENSNSRSDQSSLRQAAFNKMSRSSHMSYMQDSIASKVNPIPMPIKQHLKTNRKLVEELPKQPHNVKGANQLLAASASQVSAYRKAFKNSQQILQAEMLHVHVQDQPQHIHQPKKSQQYLQRYQPVLTRKPPIQKESNEEVKQSVQLSTISTNPGPSNMIMKPALKQVKAEVLNTKTSPTSPKEMPTPMAVTVACNSPKLSRSTVPHKCAAPSVTLDKASSSSRALQKLQQQQLHQQLRQRRQQPFESLWRYNY